MEQGSPQFENVLGAAEGQLVGGLHQCRHLGAVGPVELPGGVDGALHKVGLDGVAGLELVDPGVEAVLIDVGVLAGEDGQPGAAAVLEGVEP